MSLLTFPVSRLWKTRKLENENTAHIVGYICIQGTPVEGTMRVYTSRWNVLRSALLTFSIKVPDFTDGQRKTIPQKCWRHLTGRGNKCKFNEKFLKNERMSRIFFNFCKNKYKNCKTIGSNWCKFRKEGKK